MSSGSVKKINHRRIKELIKMMCEPNRTSFTVSRSDMPLVLSLLKKEIGE